MTRYPVTLELPVLWGDMDALGHVNNTVYARWMEQARIEYFLKLGLSELGSAGPILARQAINFRRQVAFPDRVTIAVGAARIGTTSLVLAYRVTSSAQEGATVAEGESVVVVFDYANGVKLPVSDELKSRVRQLEEDAATSAQREQP